MRQLFARVVGLPIVMVKPRRRMVFLDAEPSFTGKKLANKGLEGEQRTAVPSASLVCDGAGRR
jgi:hypothetical protein